MANTCIVISLASDEQQDQLVEKIKEAIGELSLFSKKRSGYKVNYDSLVKAKEIIDSVTADFTFQNEKINTESVNVLHSLLLKVCNIDPRKDPEMDTFIWNHITQGIVNMGINKFFSVKYSHNPNKTSRLNANRNVIFTKDTDYAKFKNEYKRYLIRKIFLSNDGSAIKSNKLFSDNLLLFRNSLINDLKQIVLERLDTLLKKNPNDEIFIKYRINKLNNLDLISINYKNVYDSNLALNILFDECEKMFSSDMNGNLFDGSSRKVNNYKKFIMARDFDTFVNDFTDGTIRTRLGMFNSLLDSQNGKYVVNIGTDMKFTYSDDTLNFKDYSSKILPLYLSTIEINDTPGLYITFLDLQHIISYIHNKYPKYLYQLRNNPDSLQSIFKEVIDLMEHDSDVRKPVKSAAKSLYSALFDNLQMYSLYNIFKREDNIKYNLYNMLLNYINTATTAKYLQTVIDETGNTEVNQIENAVTSRYAKGIKANFMVQSSMRSFDKLAENLGITPVFNKDNKLSGFSFKLNSEEHKVFFVPDESKKENTIHARTSSLISNKDKYSKFLILNRQEFGNMFINATGVAFDNAYFDFIANSQSTDAGLLFDIMMASILNTYVSDKIIGEIDENTTPDKMLEAINSKLAFKLNDSNIDFNLKCLDFKNSFYIEGAITAISKANAALNNRLHQSFIIDAEGKKLPNMTLTSAANDDAIILEKLRKRVQAENDWLALNPGKYPLISTPFYYNLFNSSDILGGTYIDLNVVNVEGDIKSVHKMTSAELGIHDFINRYLINDNYMYIQPMVYSDKSRIWVKRIELNKAINIPYSDGALYKIDTLNDLKVDQIYDLHRLTMSKQYDVYTLNFFNSLNLVAQELGQDVIYEPEDSILTQYNKLKEILNGTLYLDFIKAVDKVRNKGYDINIFLEAQYHVKNGVIQFDNALFDYFNYMYSHRDAYNLKVNIEKKLYVQALLKDGIKLFTYDFNGNINSAINKLYKLLKDSGLTDWIDEQTSEVLLYKIKNGSEQITNDDVYNDQIEVELNPYLERYFALNMLLSDNYNAMLYGFPYAHKGSGSVKSFDPLMLKNPEMMRTLKEDESARTVQENKRGVIGGATITPFKRNSLNGIPSTYRLAVILDITMPIFNLLAVNDAGQNTYTKCKVTDGAIFCNPFTSILEINSLPEINVGSVHKKPICHFDRTNVGIAGLLKCATFALNNAYIRDSVQGSGSSIDNRRLLLKMSGKQFTEEEKNKFDFSINHLYDYYYKDRTDFLDYLILSIKKNDDNTYTRTKINKEGTVSENTFNINSIYDVWEMLGGELSKIKQNNQLIFSEGSIEEVVKLINKNTFVKELFKANEATLAKTQEFYDLPLKYMMVDYLVNESAIKNGASNLNTVGFYYHDLTTSTNESIDNLVTTEIDTLFLGVQLSAEYDLSDTDISEMTQVISALEQKGLRHNNVMAIYNNIGRNIAKQLKPYIKDIDNEKNYSDLYNILGRKLVLIFATGNQGLTLAYIQAVQSDVEENKNLSDQIRRIPFDDPNISSALQTGFTSGINKQIIRRTYNGLAAVQAPSYDMIVMFEGPDGKMYKYSDLVNSCNSQEELDAKLAAMDHFVSDPSEVFIEDYVLILDENDNVINEGKVSGYENDDNLGLKNILNLRGSNFRIKVLGSKGRNLRHLNYLFEIKLKSGATQKLCLYDLDSSILAFSLKNILITSDAKNYNDLLVTLKKTKSNNYYRIKELELAMQKYSDTSFIDAINTFLKTKKDIDYDNVHSFIVLALLNDINNISTNKKITIPIDFRTDRNKLKINTDIFNVKQTSNEIMIGRLLAQKFGIEPGDSINDILADGYFESKVQRLNHNPVDTMVKYDFQFNRLNGNHLYVVTDRDNFEQMVKDKELSLYRAQISYEDGKMVKVENDSVEYPIHKSYLFATYTIPGTNETMEFVYVPSERVGKFIKDVESTHNYNSLRINPRIENQKVIDTALNTSRTINKQVKQLFNAENTYEESLKLFNDLHNEYYDNEKILNANKLRRSFEQFLNFIGTRIPSQSMQSFMNMKVVGFIDMDTNIIWHNPALIVWTGSDFDIDKIYMLGCSISDNGVYDTWSDLFDFSSRELFQLSNLLDIPVELTGESTNLDKILKAIKEDDLAGAAYEYLYPTPETTKTMFAGDINAHKAYYFEKIVKAINYVTRNNLVFNVALELDEDYYKPLQQLFTAHFGTHLSGKRELEVIKNKIYFDMIYNGDDVVNWVMLTTPISMSDAQNAASNSIEGAYSKQLSNFNPYARFIAQFQNSIGKDGIGIFATGIKIWSMISTYFNDLYLHNDLTQIGGYNVESKGEFLGYNKDGQKLVLNQFKIVPNLNFDMFMANSNEERKALLKEQYDRGYIPSDVYASLSTLLSAATDNAKELILEKINASPELAGIYAYMLVTGISFKDAADFMIHPIISKVVNKSRKNVFDASTKYRNIPNAINYYLKGVDIKNYINNKEYSEGLQAAFLEVTKILLSKMLFMKPDEAKIHIDKFLNSLLFANNATAWRSKKLPKRVSEDELIYSEMYDESMDEFVSEFDDYFDDEFDFYDKVTVNYNVMVQRYFKEVLSRLNDLQGMNEEQVVTNLNTLRDLHTAAQELTIIGRGGSLNQGIKTLFAEKISFETQIENFINNQIKKNKDKLPKELLEYLNFDLVQYCNDEEYRSKMIQVYEYVKDTFNILAIWDNVPHFKQMFKTYGAVDNVLNEFIPFLYGKKKLICKSFIERGFIKAKDQKAMKKIDRYLLDLIAYKFLTLFNASVTIPKGNKIYQDNKIVTTPIDKELDFSNPNDIATFKLYMESVVFDKLKLQYDNNFVNSLQLDKALDDYGMQYTFMKVPLNSDYNDNDANERLYNELLYAFNKIALSKTPGLNMNIQDAFALYNIITNSNRTNSNTFSKMLIESIKDPDSILVLYSNFVADENNYHDVLPDYDEILFRIIPYNETVNDLRKEYDRIKKNPVFKKDGRTLMFISLNNAIKLPYIANTTYDIDDLLDQNILGQILRLASLNKFELKLKCDD